MSFVAPLLLVGLLGAALPLVLHLVGRRRAPIRRFAALDFVLGSDRRLARRLRVRHLLVLALRMLLVAGLAVMLAKPFVETRTDLPAVGGQAQAAVLILDDSLSMSRRQGGRPLLDLARERAVELVKLLGPEAEVAVLSLTDPSGPLPALTRDRRKVLAAIAEVTTTWRHATLARARIQAHGLLSSSSMALRTVFFLSDLAAHTLGAPRAAAGGGAAAKGITLRPIRVGDGAAAHNAAVVGLTAAPSTAPGVRATRITARVCNHGPRRRELQATLQIDGRRVARGVLELDAWACGNKSFEHAFVRGGLHRAAASLEPDALTADDQRHLLLEVESAIRVLLVNGAPSPVRHLDELFYLRTALATAGQGGQPVTTRQITEAELGKEALDSHDVVVLANVRALSPARAARLEAMVSKGGGLLISVGDQVDPVQLSRSLGGLLPQQLRGPMSATPPGEPRSAALRLGRVDRGHPVIGSIWSGRSGGGLRSARFSRVFRLRPATRQERRVLAWYDDGSPALLEARRGEGRVVLFTSTLDRDWNDLPIRPGFLPLVQQLVRHLSRTSLRTPREPVQVGQRASIRVPEVAATLRVEGPGVQRRWSARDLQGNKILELPVERPGFYRVDFSGADGTLRQLREESFAASVSPLESDLRPGTLPDQPNKGGARLESVRKVELWHALGPLLLLLLLLESILLRSA